jgi:hypothetical protein
VPLVAGLAELQPWVDWWHAEVDPGLRGEPGGVLPGAAHRPAAQVGKTLEELTAWRPARRARARPGKEYDMSELLVREVLDIPCRRVPRITCCG